MPDHVVYLRVSTTAQGRSGLGLEAQQAAVARYLKGRPGRTLETVTEVESGKRDDRPELMRALRRCRLSGAVLVVAKLDRLSRDQRFIHGLRDAGVEFVVADMPEANTLTIGVMAALAQYERELISERTRAGLAAAKARGAKLGGPNLARDRNTDTRAARAEHVRQSVVRNDELRGVIEELVEEAGRTLTMVAIAERLNGAGYRTARGKAFTRSTVHRLLNWKPPATPTIGPEARMSKVPNAVGTFGSSER